MLTRVILATTGAGVAVGAAVATGSGVAVASETGLTAGARVVGVAATGATVAAAAGAGAVVAAGAAVALGVAVASPPQATIIAAMPTMSHRGLTNHSLNLFDSIIYAWYPESEIRRYHCTSAGILD